MVNELIEFKDNFLVNFFEETKYNTSKKPGLLKNLFQNTENSEIYRFKIGALNSIVKEFEFNINANKTKKR